MSWRHPVLQDLPADCAVFPLPGALLLPTGRLPLNIFEPRYLALVEDALSDGRMFGMIQPNEHAEPAPASRGPSCTASAASAACPSSPKPTMAAT